MEGEMEVNVDKRTHELQHALAHAENIIATLREPFVVLDKSLRVRIEGITDRRRAEAAMKDGG
jgi:hypothetical protein